MNETIKKRNMFFVVLLVLITIASAGTFVFMKDYIGSDLRGHWKICAYTLHGMDPFPLVNKKAAIKSIGKIPYRFTTVPWACVFGNVLYGGWFSKTFATAYIILLHPLSAFALIFVLLKKISLGFDKQTRALIALAVLSHFSLWYSMMFGNAGGIICCLLIIAVLIAEEHPFVAGVLVSIGMMKPQIALILCIVLLLNKRLKVLITAAVIDIAGWVVTALMTHTSMITLLKESLSAGVSSDDQYLGLLSFLYFFGVSKGIVSVLNAVIGLAYVGILWFMIKKSSRNLQDPEMKKYAEWLGYTPACAASVFWIYKNGTDFAILAFLSVMFIILMKLQDDAGRKEKGVLIFLCIGFLQASRLVVSVIMTQISRDSIWSHGMKSLEGFVIMIIGIILVRKYLTVMEK